MNNIKWKIALVCFFVPLLALSQTERPVKKIEVAGEAEMEVTPDEIYIRITLKEYLNGRKKVAMDKLEGRLVKAVTSEDIPKGDLTVENIFGYNWNWKKQRAEDFLATKSFRLKVKDLKKMNDLLERLDERGINGVTVASYTHSKLKQYKRELKLEALKNAKEKAAFLLNGIDEQLGPVIEVHEVSHMGPQPVLYRTQTMEATSDSDYQSNVEFKTIKIQAQVRAVFGIQ